jgi:processing peptidase subunit alpha
LLIHPDFALLTNMLSPARALSKRVHALATTSLRHFSESALAPTFSEVKFVKEDLGAVMSELPDYNFYEMKEHEEYPYQGRTLDRSIVLDPKEPSLVAPKTEFSKLENGLKIASIDKQGLTASLGLMVNAGSRFETSANFGVSHMVELMAYKSTAHLSHLRTVKTLEQLGASLSSTCTAGREEIVYQVDVMREFVPLVVPLIVGNVLFPRLLPWEVKAAVAKVKEARAQLASSPDDMINELLHKAAYCNNTLGLSPIASERSIPYFTPDTIRSFMLDHFAPERMVLVGVNVSHSELTKWAMRSFADYNAIPLKDRPETPANYTGGDARLEGASPYCHLAIGLESAAWGQPDLAPMTLLQTILGGGSATGGTIGAGTTSRLSTQVVKENPYVESCSAFNMSYSDSGLFGVYSVAAPDKAGEVCSSVTSCLGGLTSITEDEITAAKAILKGQLHRQVDDSATTMKDLGTQILVSGRYGSAVDFAKIIDGVTKEQAESAAKKLLSSKPTVAAFGDTHTVPHYSAIEAALN